MATDHAIYALKLMNNFEAAVRAHELHGASYPEEHAQINKDYERAKEKLARKIGQLAKDAARAKALQAKLDDMYDYKDRSPL